MAKIISNGKEVEPKKKVKLHNFMTQTEINKLLIEKVKELKNG